MQTGAGPIIPVRPPNIPPTLPEPQAPLGPGMPFNPQAPIPAPIPEPVPVPWWEGLGGLAGRCLGLLSFLPVFSCEGVCATPQPTPQTKTEDNSQRNRGSIQIQGSDITPSNRGAVKDTNPKSGYYMLSFSWDLPAPTTISVKEGRRALAALWKNLTAKQMHRRDSAYYGAVAWIDASLTHSPPGRVAGEHFAYKNSSKDQDGVYNARVDVSVFEGVAFNTP